MFVSKFVPTIYDGPALQVLIGCHNKSANQIAHCSIIVNTRNELQNKHWNFATNIWSIIHCTKTHHFTELVTPMLFLEFIDSKLREDKFPAQKYVSSYMSDCEDCFDPTSSLVVDISGSYSAYPAP